MQMMDAPKANPEKLLSIVEDARAGKVVLPSFQRSFVWDRDNIETLLASVLEGYFIGTLLMLDTPADDPMFPFRTVEGLEQVHPEVSARAHGTLRLLLDGQQRISSLFYALYAPPGVALKWATYPHRFYLDLELALSGDLDEAVIGVSTQDRRRLREVDEGVASNRIVPFTSMRDFDTFTDWLEEQERWQRDDRRAVRQLFRRFQEFMIPVVSLSADTGKQNVINIFERINSTGVNLSLFDLAVARLYTKKIDLRSLWDAFRTEYPAVAQVVRPEAIFRVITLLQGREPRKASLLDTLDALDPAEFHARWADAATAVVTAHTRIRTHYGAVTNVWIPYSTMIVPLAALLYRLAQSRGREDAYRKVDGWYWANVFSQRYDSAVDTKSMSDLRDVLAWIDTGSVPEWIRRLDPATLNLDVDEPRSAVYRGLMCLVVRQGAHDFLTGQSVNLAQCQDDHIFPKAVYGKRFPVDAIRNRTLISAPTNNEKRHTQPSAFMEECLQGHGGDEERLLDTLASHFISPEAHLALQLNEFDEFVSERAASLHLAVASVLPEMSAPTEVLSQETLGLPTSQVTSSDQPNVWLVRAGANGAQERLALDESIAVIGWDDLGDLSSIRSREALESLFVQTYGGDNVNRLRNYVGQVWAFRSRIQPGDLVVLPLKTSHKIAIGRVTDGYQYRPDLPLGARHTQPVEWLVTDLPREAFGQQVLNSLGAFMTVCKLDRNGADEHIRAAVGQDSRKGAPDLDNEGVL